MKKVTIILAVLSVVNSGMAQQLPIGSQYYQNMFVLNPAFTGARNNVKAFASHRSQFNGLPGGPKTSLVAVNGPMQRKNVGFGVIAYTDATDILVKNSAMLNYSYGIRLGEVSVLHFGLAMGAQNYRIDFNKASVVNSSDQVLFENRQGKTVFNSDFGMLLEANRLKVGFSIPQLLTHSFSSKSSSAATINYQTKSHFITSLSYELPIKGAFEFIPSTLVRYVPGAPVQFDLNGVLNNKRFGWIGMTYHSTSSFAVSAGVRYKDFTFGFAQDFSIGVVSRYAQSSSEALVSYEFGNKFKQIGFEDDFLLRQELEELKKENARQKEILDSLNQKEKQITDKINGYNESNIYQKRELDSLLALQMELRNQMVSATKLPMALDKKKGVNQSPKEIEVYENVKFKDEAGKTPEPGYYIVVGSFIVKKNAINWMKRSKEMGHADTKLLLNKELNMREVYVFYTKNRVEAIELREIYSELTKKAWVLELK
jgi:type IX secretion system PorP/SprF family membrane protein